MSAEGLPSVPRGFTPPSGAMAIGDFKLFGQLNAQNTVFNETLVNIDQRNGGIHAVAVKNFSEQNDAVSGNDYTINVLNAARKLLKGTKLNKEEKHYKNIALKVADFYEKKACIINKKGKDADRMRNEIAESLGKLELGLQKQMIMAETRQTSKNNEETIIKWGEEHLLPSAEEMKASLKNIANGKGHDSDGQDIVRHLLSGVVSAKGADDTDLFEQSDVSRVDLAFIEPEPEPEEKVRFLADRMNVIFKLFKQAITHKNPEADEKVGNEITELIDQVSQLASVDAADKRIIEKMDQWRKSNDPELQNLGRLAHTLNQRFHMTPMSQGTLMHLKGRIKGSPASIYGMSETDFKQAGDKEINVKMDHDGSIEVQHRAQIKQTQPPNSTVSITQIVTLSSNTNDLSDWNYSLMCTVNVGSPEYLGIAEKVYDIYQLTKIPSELRKNYEA